MIATCPACGAETSSTADAFCGHCGAAISVEGRQVGNATVDGVGAPTARRTSSIRLRVAAVVTVLLLTGAAGYWLILQRSRSGAAITIAPGGSGLAGATAFEFKAYVLAGRNFQWDCGDGMTEAGQAVHHVYQSRGVFPIGLTYSTLGVSTRINRGDVNVTDMSGVWLGRLEGPQCRVGNATFNLSQDGSAVKGTYWDVDGRGWVYGRVSGDRDVQLTATQHTGEMEWLGVADRDVNSVTGKTDSACSFVISRQSTSRDSDPTFPRQAAFDMESSRPFRRLNTGSCEGDYRSGAYVLSNRRADSAFCFYEYTPAGGGVTDWGPRKAISVKVALLDGSATTGFGIAFGESLSHSFFFIISENGQYAIDRWDGQWIHLSGGWESAINVGIASLNTLTVELNGNTFECAINGKRVYSNSTAWPTYPYLGFVAAAGQSVTFDDLVLRR